jgi:hypothetical protein
MVKHDLQREGCIKRIDFGAPQVIPRSVTKNKKGDPLPKYLQLLRPFPVMFDMDVVTAFPHRRCGCEKKMCTVCWPLCVEATKFIVDELDRLGFPKETALVVYSSGGIHLFYPPKYSHLISTAKVCLSELFALERVDETDQTTDRVLAVLRAYSDADDKEQELPESVCTPAKTAWARWKESIESEFDWRNVPEGLLPLSVLCLPKELDWQVTTKPGHLLKSVFSVHPRTGEIDVVIDLSAPISITDVLTTTNVFDNMYAFNESLSLFRKTTSHADWVSQVSSSSSFLT